MDYLSEATLMPLGTRFTAMLMATFSVAVAIVTILQFHAEQLRGCVFGPAAVQCLQQTVLSETSGPIGVHRAWLRRVLNQWRTAACEGAA